MKTTKIMILSALVMLLALTACQSPTGQVTKTEDIKIGFIAGLTGFYAEGGTSDLHAMELAVDEINAAGGIDGRMIRIIAEDGQCSPKAGATAAQKLVHIDRVDIILGGSCSSETLAAAPIVEQEGVLLFSSSSTSPDVTEAGDFVFRNSHSDKESAKMLATYALEQGHNTIAVMIEQNAYPEGFGKEFINAFEQQGGKIVQLEKFQVAETEFKSSLTKIMADKPDGILIASISSSGGVIAKELTELGYDGQLYGNVIMADPVTTQDYGDFVTGLIYSDAKALDRSRKEVQQFVDSFESRYGETLTSSFYQAAKYDAVHIIAQAIDEVGTDPVKIKEHLYTMDEYDGLIGTYSFDEHGDVSGLGFEIRQLTAQGTVNIA